MSVLLQDQYDEYLAFAYDNDDDYDHSGDDYDDGDNGYDNG
jgi:hypothetical protein